MKIEIMQSTKAQTTVRIILGFFLVFAGVSHLSFLRKEFLAQVPDWMPMQPDMVVLLSGVVEILLGAALLFLPKQLTSVGWIVALFFVAVFPGNIAQLINHKDAFGLNSDLLRWIRLPFQPLLIVLVLWSTGAWSTWRNKIKLKNQFHELLPQ
ncbi:MAG: hypothetical protein SGI96_17610 [Bacteroidota bacterium]|nr:hypothetical protein [Bacteroidota bacterium]